MNTIDSEQRIITHVVIDELPSKGLQKLYFYTSTESELNHGKYYWGTDNNSFNQEFINNLVSEGQIIAVPSFPKLEKNKCLWLNSKGEIFLLNTKDPYPKDGELDERYLILIINKYNKS